MWLVVLSIAVVLLTMYLLIRGKSGTRDLVVESRVPATGLYRIWTEGKRGNVNGRYYLVSVGLNQDDVSAITQQSKIALPELRPGGANFFIFRQEGDYEPLRGREGRDLSPIGLESNTHADDRFEVEAMGVTGVVLKTSPALNSLPINPCFSTDCVEGTLRFGGSAESVYQLVPINDGYQITQQGIGRDGGIVNYLYTVTQSFCPAPENGSTLSQLLKNKCTIFPPGVLGGPSFGQLLPATTAGAGNIFYFERVSNV